VMKHILSLCGRDQSKDLGCGESTLWIYTMLLFENMAGVLGFFFCCVIPDHFVSSIL
jgi:hypothetical protein